MFCLKSLASMLRSEALWLGVLCSSYEKQQHSTLYCNFHLQLLKFFITVCQIFLTSTWEGKSPQKWKVQVHKGLKQPTVSFLYSTMLWIHSSEWDAQTSSTTCWQSLGCQRSTQKPEHGVENNLVEHRVKGLHRCLSGCECFQIPYLWLLGRSFLLFFSNA